MLLSLRSPQHQSTSHDGVAPGERDRTATISTFRWLDSRFGSARFIARGLNRVFPDHWSFLTGEICLYSFVILLITGAYLALFFRPSGHEVIYEGRYTPLKGIPVSAAYASMLHLSFDVRGGLLIRQIHDWTTLVFFAAIVIHGIRVFFTGAFRRPRELNWVIGIVILSIALIEGWSGYSLPDDLLSGTGVRVAYGVLESVPVVGTYLTYLIFGGGFPGTETFIPRLYVVHVLLIPGILVLLVAIHVVLVWVQRHTDFRGLRRTEQSIVGSTLWPNYAARAIAVFLTVAGVVSLLAGVAQVNPIWLYGPASPLQASAGSQSDWYMGFLDGAIRLMPRWEPHLWGHTLVLSVFLPALLLPGVLFAALGAYPWIERWVTRDRAPHELLDRPRERPKRTALGVAILTFCGILLLGAANDVIALRFHVSLYAITWALRVLVIVGPLAAAAITRRIALGLQARDASRVLHGHETGRVSRDVDGGYHEGTIAISDEEHARIEPGWQPRPPQLPPDTASPRLVPGDCRRQKLPVLLWRAVLRAFADAHANARQTG